MCREDLCLKLVTKKPFIYEVGEKLYYLSSDIVEECVDECVIKNYEKYKFAYVKDEDKYKEIDKYYERHAVIYPCDRVKYKDVKIINEFILKNQELFNELRNNFDLKNAFDNIERTATEKENKNKSCSMEARTRLSDLRNFVLNLSESQIIEIDKQMNNKWLIEYIFSK